MFCELPRSGDVQWVAAEQEVIAFFPLTVDALAPGHTLVAPRAHSLGILDTPPATLTKVMSLLQRVAVAMTESLGATGVVVLNASGPHSGQSVDHLHFHVVPCWEDDAASFWPRDRSAHRLPGPLHERIAAALASHVLP